MLRGQLKVWIMEPNSLYVFASREIWLFPKIQ